jgi:hypothetical protein
MRTCDQGYERMETLEGSKRLAVYAHTESKRRHLVYKNIIINHILSLLRSAYSISSTYID